MSSFDDVVSGLNILIEYPINLPYVKTGIKYRNKYIVYKYNDKKFVKVFDDDNKCHMVYVGDFWEGSSLQRFLNTTGGEWWSPQNE